MEQTKESAEADAETNSMQLKKDKLICYIPFITQMINKVNGSEFLERKWKLMLQCIESDKKKMSIEQIEKLDTTLKKLKAEHAERTKIEIESLAKAPVVVSPPAVPKPADLGKPALTTDDLQSLIEDLSGPDEVDSPQVAKEVERLPSLVKPEVKEVKKLPKVRLPSSWLPSKTTPPTSSARKEKEKDFKLMNASGLLTGTSLLKTFKIPKLNKSPLSSPGESPQRLKVIDIFRPLSEITKPVKWESLTLEEKRKKLQLKMETQPIDKIKIIRSPSIETQHQIIKVPKSAKVESEFPRIRVKAPEELLAEMEWSPVKSISFEGESSKLKTEKEESSCVQETSFEESPKATPKRRETSLEDRRNKELRRLHENIVKDEVPLSTRRSCTIKRSSSGYRDSPVNTDDDDQDKPVVKRMKNDAKYVAVTLENRRKTPEAAANEATPENRRKTPVTTPENRRKTLQVPAVAAQETRRKFSPIPIKISQVAVKTPQVAVKTPHTPIRFTRKSQPVEEPPQPAKKLCRDSSLESLEKVIKSFDLKPCAINLPSITAEELLMTPLTVKQVARKSTAPSFISKARKRPAPLSNVKPIPTRTLTTRSSKVEETNDDEWEDLEESDDEEKPLRSTTFIYRQICNVAFTHCRSGVIFKCLLDGCKFQTLQKHTFVKHLETRHKTETWNGYCNICLKTVLKTKPGEGYSMINEFIHLMEEHLQREVVEMLLKLPEVPSMPEHDTESSEQSEIDPELMKGIDSILDELLPDQVKEKAQLKAPPPVTSQQIVISKNIVGRVIPMSKLPANILTNSTKIKLPNGATFTVKKPPVAVDKSTEEILKHVLYKPVNVATPIVQVPPVAQDTVVRKNPGGMKKAEVNYLELLRPWLRKPSTKSPRGTQSMMTSVALSATYKCMGSSCSFFTSDPSLFLRHLTFHEKFTPNDRSSYLNCCYCVFETLDGKPEDIVEHIKVAHGCDKFQCGYCFYRSCVDFNVMTHQNNFHKMKPRLIMEIQVNCDRNDHEELEKVKKTRIEFVPPITCVFCREVFYVFKTFLNHINEHQNTLNTKCIKCGERTTKSTLHRHLVNCHGFGLFQCVYCRFGTNTFEIISSHIANEHPSRLPLFCERSEYKTSSMLVPPAPSSIESTCLKHINQTVPKGVTVTSRISDYALRNYMNLGHLGDKFHIRGFNDEAPPLDPPPRIPAIIYPTPPANVSVNNSLVKIAPAPTPKGDEILANKTEMRARTMSLVESIKKPILKSPVKVDKVNPDPEKKKKFKIPGTYMHAGNLQPLLKTTPQRIIMQKLLSDEKFWMPKTEKPTKAPEPKPLGLQIQSVFSLSESAMQGGFQHSTKFLVRRSDDD